MTALSLGVSRRVDYVSAMRAFLVTAVLVALLAFAVWYAVDISRSEEIPPMPLIGWLALIGGGLVALMFYSHRHGYDDLTIDPKDRKRK